MRRQSDIAVGAVLGRIWVPCGLFLIVNAFLNIGRVWVCFVLFVVMIVIPVGYSFGYHVKHPK